MIRTTNVRDGRIDLSECRCVEEATYERWTRRAKVLDGDVILTREAPIGEVGFVNGLGSVFLGQRIMQFRPDPSKIEPRYLYYAFRSPDLKHQFGMHDGSGSVVSHIRVADCHEFKVSAPPLSQQKLVVELLGSIDDKIELNRRLNETLEAMAQAIFRDWFVDFGPVRRKLAGETNPVAIMGGLTPDPTRAAELAALFPGILTDDRLPEGWGKSTLGHLFDVRIGKTPPRKEKEHFEGPGVGVPWCSIRDMAGGDTFVAETAETLRPESVGRHRVARVPELTVILSFKLTVGRVAISDVEMTTNEAIAHMLRRAGSPSPWFTFCHLRQFDYGSLGSTSSIATAVNSASIKGMPILVPPSPITTAFDVLVGPFFERIRAAARENRTLAETRDYLLPRLMSGQVRVAEANTVIEETAA